MLGGGTQLFNCTLRGREILPEYAKFNKIFNDVTRGKADFIIVINIIALVTERFPNLNFILQAFYDLRAPVCGRSRSYNVNNNAG